MREEGLGGLRLLAARELGELREVLALLDRILLPTLLLGALLATGLAMGLAGEALKPLSQATRAALNLARERAWQRRLPSPRAGTRWGSWWRPSTRCWPPWRRPWPRSGASPKRPPTPSAPPHPAPGRAGAGQAGGGPDPSGKAPGTGGTPPPPGPGGGGHPGEVPLALDGLVFEETEALRPAFRARDLRLEVELPEEPAWVLAHPAALRAAVVSLLENALEHTARGDGCGSGWTGRSSWWKTGPAARGQGRAWAAAGHQPNPGPRG